MGCWDKRNRHYDPFLSLEPPFNTTHKILVDWQYKNRTEAIKRCALAATSSSSSATSPVAFGVIDGGQCWQDVTDDGGIFKRGMRAHCVDGLGSAGSYDVYLLPGRLMQFTVQYVDGYTISGGKETLQTLSNGNTTKHVQGCL